MNARRRSDRHGPSRVRRRLSALAMAVVLASSAVAVAPVAGILPASPARAAGSFADPAFREFPVFTGLTKPTSVRFASDGRAFVAEKAGVIKAFDSITDTSAVTVADLSADTMNYWDRGLLGLAVDPAFLTGRPYLYVFYVWGAKPGDTPQDWSDACPAAPTGPGGTTDGCPASTKVDRLELNPATNALVTRTNLLWDACQQFPSHSGGGMTFGADGQLYISFGDGASFGGVDYGQRGGTIPDYTNPITPVNPCGDPVTVTSATGAAPTVDVKSAQGGQLRSQDLRTTGDPLGLGGTIVRINPDTGAASTGNPLASSSSATARRVIAIGWRNPFRLAARPGTNDIYVAHVGNQSWEAINRVQVASSATPTTIHNAGWPCYEGPETWRSFQALGTTMCANLYAQGGAVTPPVYAYGHWTNQSPTGPCYNPASNGVDGGSPTGLAFYTGSTGGTASYPAKYQGGLFFVDYDRDCLAMLPAGAGGVPSAAMQQVASGIANPVDLATGPGGDLYYVDYDGGRVVRIRYAPAPVAAATATPEEALAPVTVQLDATDSTDPDPSASLIAYRWDLDADGQYDDATGATFSWDITVPAVYPVGLEVESSNGTKDTTSITVDATNDPPVPAIDAPTPDLTWAVGDTIPFSGGATDAQDGALAGASLAWDVVMLHCPADCHEHVVESFSGTAGSFEAPDHEYPSHLLLRLTATDTHGTSRSTSVELQPLTRTVDVASAPSGATLVVGDTQAPAPFSVTVLANGAVAVSAPRVATLGGVRHRFWSWSDGGARIHDITVPDDVELTATYLPDVADTCSTAATSPTTTWLTDRAGGDGDADWFKFTLSGSRRVVVTLGDLPVDGRLDLYAGCSTRLATSDASGKRFEEITRTLAAGTYRVRVSFPGGGSSTSPYVVRFRPLAAGLAVKSARTTAGAGGGGPVRIVGEVLNTGGTTRGRPVVTATFRAANGATVGTLTARAFSPRIAAGSVTPFVVSGTVPVYASVSYSVTSGTVPRATSLDLVSLTRTSNPDGTVTETGKVRNTGTRTLSDVAVARTWYGRRGEVLERGSVFLVPSALAPGASGSWTITRPVLTGVQATRTSLRAR